jgi:hypothetical protein
MKLRNHQFSTQPRIFEGGGYEHPWYKKVNNQLNKPKPPSKEAVEKAKFVDKTYQWSGDNRIRSGNKRTTK